MERKAQASSYKYARGEMMASPALLAAVVIDDDDETPTAKIGTLRT